MSEETKKNDPKEEKKDEQSKDLEVAEKKTEKKEKTEKKTEKKEEKKEDPKTEEATEEVEELKLTDETEDGSRKKDDDQTETEDLPDDIKERLEKKKKERAKKPLKKKRKKKEKKQVKVGKAYIKATYNNTIVTLGDTQGNIISWASAGLAGFKGPKKSTPYAAQIITKIAVMKAREEYGLEEVSVFVKGVGTGRESAVRSLNANGLYVTSIKDITPIPHNGCRARKPRRV